MPDSLKQEYAKQLAINTALVRENTMLKAGARPVSPYTSHHALITLIVGMITGAVVTGVSFVLALAT